MSASIPVRAHSLLVVLVLVPAAATAQSTLPVIGEIEVVGHEVFEAGGTAPYRFANRLHVRTRERIVRNDLLFESGDPVDYELIEQTERNLRGLPFLRDARLETTEVDSDGDGATDRLDVRVTTWDRWTLSPRVDFQQVEDRTLWELGVSEKNLLGFGKAVTLSHRQNLDRTIDRLTYDDQQLFHTNITLTGTLSQLSDGYDRLLIVDRPFLSLRDPWTYTIGAGGFRRTDPIVEHGVEVDRLRHRGRWGDLVLGRAIVRRDAHAIRLVGAYRFRSDHVGTDRREFGIAEVGLQAVSHRFVRLTHVNQFERTEDFNLGTESHVTLGLASEALGGAAPATFVAAGHQQGVVLRDEHFVILNAAVGGRREGASWRNLAASAGVRYLLKPSPRTAIIGRVDYVHGHRFDPEVQLRLGIESGLRGYPVRQFTGNRSLLLSIEERWFVADDVWQLFSLGVAGFFDSGFVWPEGQPVHFGDLRSAIGVSLLVGSHRLAARGGVRFDLGYALNPIDGVKRWAGAAFSDIGF